MAHGASKILPGVQGELPTNRERSGDRAADWVQRADSLWSSIKSKHAVFDPQEPTAEGTRPR